MFSVEQKRYIAEKVQEILKGTNHPELPDGEISFLLHVDGVASWSWADIRNNGSVANPGVDPWNELQAAAPAVAPTPPLDPRNGCKDVYHRPGAMYCETCLPKDAPLGALLVGTRKPTQGEIKLAAELEKRAELIADHNGRIVGIGGRALAGGAVAETPPPFQREAWNSTPQPSDERAALQIAVEQLWMMRNGLMDLREAAELTPIRELWIADKIDDLMRAARASLERQK